MMMTCRRFDGYDKKRLSKVDIHEELKQMLGKQVKFKGLQKLALKAIVRNKSPILVILGIGASKSLMF
jgi:thiosulfate reductase cytochrome b subunit